LTHHCGGREKEKGIVLSEKLNSPKIISDVKERKLLDPIFKAISNL